MAKRPNILKLATKISLESMTYMGITYDDPEYKILEPIIDDDMCAIMMHVRLETNRTVEEVAKRARKSVEFTQEQLDKLCKTGAVRASPGYPLRGRQALLLLPDLGPGHHGGHPCQP